LTRSHEQELPVKNINAWNSERQRQSRFGGGSRWRNPQKISEAGDLTTCAWTGGEVQMFSFDLEERADWIGGAGK
jgi:hypothetical protein